MLAHTLRTFAARGPTLLREQVLWLAVLGPLFFLTYGAANALAGLRNGVPSLYFEWERLIPFLDWTIVPYWSIDGFYALSLFICATREELATHVRRLLAAQAVAVTAFIVVPLRFAFERPATDGVFGAMFDLLGAFDKPFNQAPSLHIALLVILWVLYARHARGAGRWLLHGWFALIGISVLTTWQHHFVDVPAGLWLGWLCVWLFPEGQPAVFAQAQLARDPQRLGLAALYGAGALAVAVTAIALGGWALWSLWVAGSLALVSAIYLGLGASAFQKEPGGGHSTAARWLLGPYFLGAWVNARLWMRGRRCRDEIVPGLWIGNAFARRGIPFARIVDLAPEIAAAPRGAQVLVPLLDLVAPSAGDIDRAVAAIGDASRDRPVLVRCALGYSRSATACAAWLLAHGHAGSITDAAERVRRARLGVVLSPYHFARIAEWRGAGYASQGAAAK